MTTLRVNLSMIGAIVEKKKRFRLFDSQREGKGIRPEDVIREPNLKKFFIILKENIFERFLYLNVVMIIGNLPLVFLFLALAGIGAEHFPAPTTDLFAPLHSLSLSEGLDPASLALIAIAGGQSAKTVYSTLSYVFFGISALALFTWGPVCVATTYVLRNICWGRPVFFWSDMFDTIKKNLRQALPYGMLDLALLIVIPFNIYNLLTSNGSSPLSGLFLWMNIAIGIVYFVMRFYIYLQMVSFDLSIAKILKNSLRFVLIGFKRNLMALLGMICVIGILVLFFFGFGGYLIAIPFALLLLCVFSLCSFMAVYAAWFKILDIMVSPEDRDPYHSDAVADDTDASDTGTGTMTAPESTFDSPSK